MVPILIAVLLVMYSVICLIELDKFPPVNQDEPWIASVAYKVATQGVLGTDLFAGFFGMERHYFLLMPLQPLLLAGIFKIAGLGLLQIRLLSVAFGLLILLMTLAIAKKFDCRLALIALVLLVFLCPANWNDQTGIPLLDFARVGRYDILVPFFGLMALWAFERAQKGDEWLWYGVTGSLIGFSCLTHLYGAFWLPALVLVMVFRHGQKLRFSGTIMMMAGFALTCLPWIVYVWSNWSEYVAQNRVFADRFEFFNPRFYLNNLLNEIERYRPLWIRTSQVGTSFPTWGAIATLIGLPCAVALSWVRRRVQPGMAAISTVLLVQLLLFALLVKPKFYSYIISFWPLAVLLLSWLWLQLWILKKHIVAQLLLLCMLAATVTEGAIHITRSIAVATHTSSEIQFAARMTVSIPNGARVLGLHHYWLGLSHFEYRSWVLPFLLANPRYQFPGAMSLADALEFVGPDVILMDQHINSYFVELSNPGHPNHTWYSEFWVFMKRHDAQLIATIQDSTYGTMQIYRLKKTI